MTPVASGLFEFLPYALAFAAGAAIPRRQGWPERFAIGIVALLSLLLIRTMWPGGPVEDDAKEFKHLLTIIVFVPIFGAIALLFLPRQSPVLLRRFSYLILGVDFLASLFLLRAPMTRGWHFQHIAEWIPSLGIRYHMAVDGVSLWLILLTTLTTPIALHVSLGSIQTRI